MTDDETPPDDEPGERGDPFTDGDDPFAELGADAEDPFGAPDDAEDPFADIEGVDDEEDDPLSDMVVKGEADPSAAGEETGGSLFSEVDVDGMDDDEVWARLAESEPDEAEPEATPEVTPRRDVPDEPTAAETVVDKRSYCEGCEYFSDPPEVACGYPDGEIVELVDTDRFRVRNCPIVERRRSGDISDIAGKRTTEVAVEDNETVGDADD